VQTAQEAVKGLDLNNLKEPLDPNLPKKMAIIISIRLEAYDNKDADVSQLLVLLIRTGVKEGLSAPISFDPITHKVERFIHGSDGKTAAQASLETAVEFVINLENRKVTAFGPTRSGSIYLGP
jgi:hypothetical protein